MLPAWPENKNWDSLMCFLIIAPSICNPVPHNQDAGISSRWINEGHGVTLHIYDSAMFANRSCQKHVLEVMPYQLMLVRARITIINLCEKMWTLTLTELMILLVNCGAVYKKTFDATNEWNVDLLVLSPWTLTLLRSSGGATVIMKGLLGIGSPPWCTEMLKLPYKRDERFMVLFVSYHINPMRYFSFIHAWCNRFIYEVWNLVKFSLIASLQNWFTKQSSKINKINQACFNATPNICTTLY